MISNLTHRVMVLYQYIRTFSPKATLLACLTLLAITKSTKLLRSKAPRVQLSDSVIDESSFPDLDEFHHIMDRIGSAGPRTTGSEVHNDLIAWIEQALREISGLEIRYDEYEIFRWQTRNGESLKEAGKLVVATANGDERIPISGAVPFSKVASDQVGQLVYLRGSTPITEANSKGKIILKDFPMQAIPYSIMFLLAHSTTADLKRDLFHRYSRPGFADGIIKEDLLTAGRVGAVGMIIMFDVGREQVESYFEPHQGVHYRLPAVYTGADERILLKKYASEGLSASISVDGETTPAMTRNLFAVLPGQIKERVIFETHTDGNTFVQENGSVALLTLAQYYAKQPLSCRRRTLEFAFNTGHLHISKEGTHRHSLQLDSTYDNNDLALIIPVEHLGTREIEACPRPTGQPGYTLEYSGRGETMFWCVGPSPIVLKAVQNAIARRKLDRIVVAPGISKPDKSRVPTYSSFGGIGSYYHNALLPTTSLISGPWSLWAPHFGSSAVDLLRLRSQTLALGDIYLAVENVSRQDIAGGYHDYRLKRAKGANVPHSFIPYEMA